MQTMLLNKHNATVMVMRVTKYIGRHKFKTVDLWWNADLGETLKQK